MLRRLKRPVTITGDPVFGHYKATVTLGPAQEKHPYSWVIQRPGSNDVVISPDTVDVCMAQNLAVKSGRSTIAHTLEHLLPLKMLGLWGVTITDVSHCLPFFGSIRPYITAVIPACEEIGMDEVPIMTISKECTAKYPKPRGGRMAGTFISPREDGRLIVSVSIAYPGMPAQHRVYNLTSGSELFKIADSKSQGWPMSRYRLSQVATRLGLWKHHNHTAWMQYCDEDEFINHRCVDLLGAIATIMNGFKLSATIRSVCSGHSADLEACRIACRNLVPIVPV